MKALWQQVPFIQNDQAGHSKLVQTSVTVPVELKYVAFLSVNRNEAHNLVSLVILDFMFLFMFCHCTFMKVAVVR